jgi:hypothetical protein
MVTFRKYPILNWIQKLHNVFAGNAVARARQESYVKD